MQEEQNVPQINTVAMAPKEKPLWKDLLVPGSIVIAGLFVGAGLYFGGGTAHTDGPAVVADTPEQPAGDLTAYNPVTEDDHARGPADAPVTIIEYSDYDCPFCARFHESMLSISETYGDDVRWIYRHFPLEQLHPNAPAVAVASECVAELAGEDAFWQFTDAYVAARGDGDQSAHGELIPSLAADVGVTAGDLSTCMESGRYNAAVQEDLDDAIETGGRGTPWSILIGPDGAAYPINGAIPTSAVEQLIDRVLESA